MTRPSKRELEREVEALRESSAPSSSATGTLFADRYPEDVREFVYQVMRDVLRLIHDRDIANRENPDRTLRYLEAVRKEYGIDEDRDRDVYRTLEKHARKADAKHWRPEDVFQTAPVIFPAHFGEEKRKRWDRHFEHGDEDAAARMIVQATYEFLAEQGRDGDGGEKVVA